jgi:hypothetical protein
MQTYAHMSGGKSKDVRRDWVDKGGQGGGMFEGQRKETCSRSGGKKRRNFRAPKGKRSDRHMR